MLQMWSMVIAVVVSGVAVALFVSGVWRLTAQIRLGGPAPEERTRPVGRRIALVFREVLGHGRFAGKPAIRAAHWAVMVSFPILALTLVSGFGQLTNPGFRLPVLDSFAPWGWLVEIIAWLSLIGIVWLIVVRQRVQRRERGRFEGSSRWQAYFVEAVVFVVVACVLVLRVLETVSPLSSVEPASAWTHPTTYWFAPLLANASAQGLITAITLTALLKILASASWLAVVGLQPTMGVAWHRFLAIINVYARKYDDGAPALGALEPLRVGGEPLEIERLDELPEDATLGAATIGDFDWKAQLDFATCTECGRCQDVCPAWATGKPLSPKLLTMKLRDHAGAVARGEAGLGDALMPGIITPEELWACTTCGACVQECPVDIEHVDHIVDLRRNLAIMESDYPAPMGQMMKKLERRENPWGLPASKRMEWAKGLPFEVPQIGVDLDSADGVQYVMWVGCAGAFDDRAKKTTRALAELLHIAGVSFAVLGDGEACTGDPARRAGNEILFQTLAKQNIETLNEVGAVRIVVTCAHCFNTIANEYPELGGTYEVVHHTQLLNRLVRDGALTLAPPPEGEMRRLTFHDPCYLGRHNQVYAPPRELIGALPGTQLAEMPRTGAGSFCCGGGGARAFDEETMGTPISANRAAEALATGAETVVTGCPFCVTMLTDGVGKAGGGAEVVDVAQLMLESARRGQEQNGCACGKGGCGAR